MDEAGTVVGRAGVPHDTSYPHPGWAEQAPDAWMRGLREAVRLVVRSSGVPAASVVALGIAAQVDGIVALDDGGRPLGPAPIWMDRRATDETERLLRALPATDIRAMTGLNPDASHGAPKVAWLRSHVDGAATYLVPAAYAVWVLTAERVQDPANASCMLLWDVRAGAWSDPLMRVFDLGPEQLAAVRDATDVAGTLRPAEAEALGLSERCRVVVGTGDEHAACLAAGVLAPGIIADVTGTAEPVAAASLEPITDEEGLLETHAHAAPGRWLIENPGFVSGGSVLWLAEHVLGCERDEVDVLAAGAPAGSDGALFLPALGGSLAPRWNEHARGVFSGLALSHDRHHLARAVLEGCAYALRDIVDRLAELGLGGDTMRVVGGGARSRTWLQIKADVTGLAIDVLAEPEATALGAAMLAGVGAGWYRDVDEAVVATLRLAERGIQPDPANREVYREAYGSYRTLFDAVEPTFTRPAAAIA
jgi:xylulokinase